VDRLGSTRSLEPRFQAAIAALAARSLALLSIPDYWLVVIIVLSPEEPFPDPKPALFPGAVDEWKITMFFSHRQIA
jgi:hypothetical protein